jgi:hypothetical protein
LDTGSKLRDHAILGTELFDMKWEPALVFDSERVEIADGGGAVVAGWLGIGSYKKRLALSVQAGLALAPDSGAPRIVAKIRAAIDRHEFGLHRPKRPWDWLSEQFVNRQIEIAAHVEVTPAARAVGRGTGLWSAGALAPLFCPLPSSSCALA